MKTETQHNKYHMKYNKNNKCKYWHPEGMIQRGIGMIRSFILTLGLLK